MDCYCLTKVNTEKVMTHLGNVNFLAQSCLVDSCNIMWLIQELDLLDLQSNIGRSNSFVI